MFKFKMLVLALFFYAQGHSQIIAPAMSPAAKVSQKIGLSNIDIHYARPSARGREIIGQKGILIPGEIWRTGANAATKLLLDNDMIVGGKLLSKGSYALLTRPGLETWDFILYEYGSGNWQSYIDKEAVIILKSEVKTSNEWQETLSIALEDLKLGSASLELSWGFIRLNLPIETNVNEKMLKVIEREMAGPTSNDYFQAALFLHEAGLELDKALVYIRKVSNGEKARFFHVYREALILADLGMNEEAIAAAKRSTSLSEKAGNKDLVRLSQQLIEKLSQ